MQECGYIDVRTIRDEIERVDRLGMNKDTSLLAEAQVAQRAQDRAPVGARRDGEIPMDVYTAGTWDVVALPPTTTTSIL